MNEHEVPDEMSEADRLIQEAVDKISEHVDSVQIFASKKREDGFQGTWKVVNGRGNYYARYGQIKQWIISEEGFEFGLKDGGSDDDES